MALSRHAKPRKGVLVDDIIAWELANLGLPAPKKIACSWVPYVHGAPAASARSESASASADAFCRGDLKQLASRHLCHVAIEFSEPVRGPILIGAGRHVGFGLLLPQEARNHAD
jgi:CRISPR-associated protein Csb2